MVRLLAIGLLIFTGCHTTDPTEQGAEAPKRQTLSIYDVSGSLLLTQDDIVAYDAKTHVIKLVSGRREQIIPSQTLIGGSPFSVFVDGKPQYSGHFTSSFSSIAIDGVVVNLDDRSLENDEIQLTLGYPNRNLRHPTDDPRKNAKVIAALKQMGKID